MSAVFKCTRLSATTSRYRNSPQAIRRFPLPFPEDAYMYSVNIEPHLPGPAGLGRRVRLRRRRALRCGVPRARHRAAGGTAALSGAAAHDELAVGLPRTDHGVSGAGLPRTLLALQAGQSAGIGSIGRSQIDQQFTFGDPATLPREPLDYITRQAQGDFVVMDQREGDLWTEAGMVTTQADWSLDFDMGMTFKEWHGPVPLAHELQVFDRALKFLLNLRLGQPVRRLNWTMTINPRLDTSPENYPKWGPDRATVTAQNAGDLVHLRVELQGLWRLPRSNAIVFGIRCYLISLRELATVPKWARRVHRVLRDLHPALIDYKGLTRYRDAAVQWLAPFDDGSPTTPGTAPEYRRRRYIDYSGGNHHGT